MRIVPATTASTTAVLGFPPFRLHAYVRLIKFRYHLSYATVVFGAVIYPGTRFAVTAGSLVLLYLLFNVLLYGGIYTLNDVADLESDRLHPSKRRRPIASGEISEDAAVSFALVMILAALAGAAWAFGPGLAWTFAGFLGVNACYSCFARNVPVLDLAFNSLTHPLRFVMGAALAGHAARGEHVAIVFVFALGVASLRRTVEKASPGRTARRTLRAYSAAQLTAVRWLALALIGTAFLWDGLASWPFFAAVIPAYLITAFGPALSADGRRLLATYWTT
jgi:decaprenyl-phosphate phosphoribosyltransferase